MNYYENASPDLQSNVILNTLQGHQVKPLVMQNIILNLIYIILCDQNYTYDSFIDIYVYFNLRFSGIRVIDIV